MTEDLIPQIYEIEEAKTRAVNSGAVTPGEMSDIEHYARQRTEELFDERGLEYLTDHGDRIAGIILSMVLDRHQRSRGDDHVTRLISELSTEGAHGAVLAASGMAAMGGGEEEFHELYDRVRRGEVT